MKAWLETRQVLDQLADLARQGHRAALATVIRVRGSAYRHEGAKMLIAQDGAVTGNVSGGCLEADVREAALQLTGAGVPVIREYCAGSDEVAAWDLGVGCEGAVYVHIQQVELGEHGALALARRALDAQARFVLCTDLAAGTHQCVTADADAGTLGSSVVARARTLLNAQCDPGGDVHSRVETVAGCDVFFDLLVPPPQLVIVSAGEDARPLARFAADVGFSVVVADRRPGLLDAARFPAGTLLVESDAASLASRLALQHESYAVVMNHNFADDRDALGALLEMPVQYIGVLGPRQRTERMIAAIGATGPVDDTRIYGPVGLDIGTDGAEQVALSVIGEILAVRSGRTPTSLRERRQPIHAHDP